MTIVRTIIDRGNKPGLITEWLDGLAAWAEANGGQDAAALRIWLRLVPPRPFYAAHELAPLWPALKLVLGLADKMSEPPAPLRLSNELEFCGMPVLKNANGTLKFHPSHDAEHSYKYFIVEHCHRWRNVELTQEEFQNAILLHQ